MIQRSIVRSRFFLVMFTAFLAVAACSDDDDPTGGGPNDDVPPGISAVTPVDAYHVDVTFNEQVTRSTAENEDNYSLIEAATPSPVSPREPAKAPGDPIAIAGATLKNDDRVVTLSTETSMAGLNVNLTVTGVSDVTGNGIQEPVTQGFLGSDTPDEAAPTILGRGPTPDATNIVLNPVVVVYFSEALFAAEHTWTYAGGEVAYTADIDGSILTLTPLAPLTNSTTYTVSVAGTDYAGNTSPFSQWSFTTTAIEDHTPPTLVSTQPVNNAINVNVSANLLLTFSEAVNAELFDVTLVPDPGEGTATSSNGGKTITFDPVAPLLDNQQYVLTIYPNGVLDLAGNGIEHLHTVTFTTGSTLESGAITGTIAGDAGSAAADPTGATVFAADGVPFGDEFNILGSTTVAGNDTYTVSHLGDGTYYLIGVLDTNHDGNFEPGTGDAVGGYGIDVGTQDFEADSVVIDGGTHATGINFSIYDPSAITGLVTYSGVYSEGEYYAYVGLFEADGFDPQNPGEPIAFGDAYWPDFREWGISTIDQPIPDGDYYVGAFLDVIVNGGLDLGEEPIGLFGGDNPQVVHIANGSDHSAIVIPLRDPLIPIHQAATIAWPARKHNPKLEHLLEMIRKAELKK